MIYNLWFWLGLLHKLPAFALCSLKDTYHFTRAVNRQLCSISPFAFKALMLFLVSLRLCLVSFGRCFVLSCLALFLLVWVCLCLVLSWLCLVCLCRLCPFFVLSLLCLVLSCLCFGCCVRLLLFLCSSLFCLVLFCFGRLRGRLASFLVVIGVVLDHFWSSLGSFWPSWGALGGPWRLLKRSWGELTPQGGAPPIYAPLLDRFLDPSWVPKGGQDGAQDETWRPQDDPRGRQDGTQDDQNRSKNRLQKRSLLRTVLRPSWGDLGPILASSWDLRRVKIVLSP